MGSSPGLQREVMVPVPSYRRPSSLIGMSIVLVLLASAVDAVVWTYQARREAARSNLGEATSIPALSHTDVAAIRARALEADLARTEEELRQLDERMLERLQGGDARATDEPADLAPVRFERVDDLTVRQCDPNDPLCGIE
jgi:hypothetical protein